MRFGFPRLDKAQEDKESNFEWIADHWDTQGPSGNMV